MSLVKSTIDVMESLNSRFVSDATEFKKFWSLGFVDVREMS